MDERLIFTSKLRVPQRHRVTVPRDRLLARMAEFCGGLFLLCGGAGFGKTELARQYCEAFEGHVLWYTLDEADNNDEAFMAYLDRLAAMGLRGYDYVGASSRVIYEICRAVEAEIDAGTRYLFVFDAAEHISEEAVLHRVRQLVVSLPEGAQVLVASRGRPPDVMARFVIDGAALLIGGPELLLDKQERHALAELALPDWTAAQRKELLADSDEMLGGWAAAVTLAFSYFKERAGEYGGAAWATFLRSSILGRYLEREVLADYNEQERDFMEKSAALEMIDGTVCGAVCGEAAEHIITRLIEMDILTEAAEGLRYNGILRLLLRLSGDTQRQNEVCRAAAERYLDDRDYTRAARQAAAAGYNALIVKILEQYGAEMLASECGDLVSLCVESLESIDFAGATPEALGVAAQHYFKAGETAKAEAYLTRADSAFGKDNKFGMYRGLYRGLLRYSQDEGKYARIINNAVFFLTENGFDLPYLSKDERDAFERIIQSGERNAHSLTVSFFGEFRAIVQGGDKPLSWRTRKSIEMFAYLAELGGEAVGRRQLLAKLWNDEMPDNAVAMLHNMIYNLRKELAAYNLTDIIRYKDKMYSLSMDRINTDLSEMHELCALANSGAVAELLPLRDSFKTYRGRYLEDIDSVWVTELREYYDAGFLKGCTILAEDSVHKGEHAQAVVFLKNALLVDPYSEELESALLKGFGAKRDLKRAKTEFERFSLLLASDLGIEPGRKLVETYKCVMNRGG